MRISKKQANAARTDNRNAAGSARRGVLMRLLQNQTGPIAGNKLARHFRISRQSLVQDIAILRASGKEIFSTPQGYRLAGAPNPAINQAVIACRHSPERTEEELHILVDHGVRVVDVSVEHPLYGELRGSLMLESRTDVAEFLSQCRATKATLLSSLTGGVHLHRIEARRPELIERAKAELHARGFLLE